MTTYPTWHNLEQVHTAASGGTATTPPPDHQSEHSQDQYPHASNHAQGYQYENLSENGGYDLRENPGYHDQIATDSPDLPEVATTSAPPASSAPTTQTPARDASAEVDYAVVGQIRARVADRLAHEENNYRELAAPARRELQRSLVFEELDRWVQQQVRQGNHAPGAEIEDAMVAAVMAELEGLGRLAPLLARTDVEDIHFEGTRPTMLRLTSGTYVQGPPIAESDGALVQMLQAIGARYGDGQTSREFSTANPILNVRLRGVGSLGARLAAEMDVVQRPMGCIRVHRHVDVTLDSLHGLGMVDTPLLAFLRAAVVAGASICVTGSPGVGKTTLLRSLVNEVPWNNVIVTVEDERELGTHLLGRHAVVKSYEQRMPNADGVGAFTMGDGLNQALRDSPTRIVVGEVRGAYVTHLLDAVTNGIAGAMCTLHAPSARGVFERVLINAQKATPAPSSELVMRSLSTLDLVVHVTRDEHHQRFVTEVIELGPVGDSGDPTATHIFAARPDGRCVGVPGSLSTDLAQRLERAGFDQAWLRPEYSDWDSAGPQVKGRVS